MKKIILLFVSVAVFGITRQTLPLQKMIDEARASGTSVSIPAGEWLIDTDGVAIRGATNLTISGAGDRTVIVSSNMKIMFSIGGSKGIVLKDFRIDYDPLPFTQGTVTAVGPDAAWVEYEIHDGYPRLAPPYNMRTAYFFDPTTRNWKPDVPDTYCQANEIISPTKGRIVKPNHPSGLDYRTICVGDRVAFAVRPAAAISYRDCENVRIEDVDILSAPGAAVILRFMRGDNYFRYNIERGPMPEGASEARLMSSSADGFNIAIAEKGPTLERCDFSFMGDDSVNFHGGILPVVHVENPATIWVTDRYSDTKQFIGFLRGGERAQFLRYGTFEPLGESVIVSAVMDNAEVSRINDKLVNDWWYKSTSPGYFKDRSTFHTYRITLSKPVAGVSFGDGFAVPSLECEGYAIRNCHFHDHRAMAIRMMAGNGVIEGCTIERIKYAAITMGPEYAGWSETGWVKNIVVRNNVIRDVCQDQASYAEKTYYPGALSIFPALRANPDKLPVSAHNSNIVIQSNVIDGASTAAIYINGGRDVAISGNIIRNVNRVNGEKTASEANARTDHAIVVFNSMNVSERDNTFGPPGPFSKGNFKDFGFIRAEKKERVAVSYALLSAEADAANWNALSVDTMNKREGGVSFKWERANAGVALQSAALSRNDWSDCDHLSFWLYAEKDNGAAIVITITSPQKSELDNYYMKKIVTAQGWQQITIRFKDLEVMRSPKGWSNVSKIAFNLIGWGAVRKPDTVLSISDIRIGYDPALQ
ncbi:MAG: carbohydrate binding domain-containing protein [Spirochaetota bacterium]